MRLVRTCRVKEVIVQNDNSHISYSEGFLYPKIDNLEKKKAMAVDMHTLEQISYLFPEAFLPRCSAGLLGFFLLQEPVSRMIVLSDLSFHSKLCEAGKKESSKMSSVSKENIY